MVTSGDTVSSTGPCIVMPFMAKGSLLSYLRDESENLFAETNNDKVRDMMIELGRGAGEYIQKAETLLLL